MNSPKRWGENLKKPYSKDKCDGCGNRRTLVFMMDYDCMHLCRVCKFAMYLPIWLAGWYTDFRIWIGEVNLDDRDK